MTIRINLDVMMAKRKIGVGELAERNPNETVSIVRQWLSEPVEN